MSKVIPIQIKRHGSEGPAPVASFRRSGTEPLARDPRGAAPIPGPDAAQSRSSSVHSLRMRVIQNVKRLYPMPHVMIKAREIMGDPRADFSRLANVLQADPALAGRVLKIANSAYYRRRGNISSVQQAATLLGMQVVGRIVTMVSQSRMLGRSLTGYGLDAGVLWRHSLAVAVLSELLAQLSGAGDRSEAFLAGLMHDSGKIILNPYLIEAARINPNGAGESGSDAVDTEQALLGFDHADIGCEVCIKWQLPVLLANAIRFHHMPHLSSENAMAYVIHLADFMAHHENDLSPDDAVWDRMDASLAFLGLTPARAISLIESAEDRLETLEEDTL